MRDSIIFRLKDGGSFGCENLNTCPAGDLGSSLGQEDPLEKGTIPLQYLPRSMDKEPREHSSQGWELDMTGD